MSKLFPLEMKKRYFLLFVIILLGVFLRFYRLQDFPVQLNHDEVSQLYDAISVAQTGKDIYGNFLPTIFPSVNDFKSPFYTYATALTYVILGDHEWIIRIPGVIFGILIIPAIYLFTVKLLGNFNIALLSSFFVAISPAEIFFSRKSFENIAGIFFMILAFYFLLIYFEKKKYMRWLYLAAIFMAAGMYTYFSHAIIIPLLAASFILIFRARFTLPIKKYFKVLFFWILLVTPLLLIILTNPGSRYRSQTVFITQDINLGKQLDYINAKSAILSTLFYYKTIVDFSFNRYLEQFNPSYLFSDGLDLTNQGPLNLGPLLLFQVPFLIFGLIYLIKLQNFSRQKKFIFSWILLGTLPSGLTFEQHSPHRSIMVFTMFNIISAVGLYTFIELVKNLKGKNIRFITHIILITAFLINFTYFIHIYFVNFPFEKSQSIHYPFKQVAQFAWSEHDNFGQIIFDPLFGESAPVIGTAAHYYLAYYGGYPPAKFQKEYRLGKKEREVIFDKFSIRKIDWRDDQYLKNVLIIGSPWSLPIQSIDIDKNKILKTFYFYNGQPAFYAVKL